MLKQQITLEQIGNKNFKLHITPEHELVYHTLVNHTAINHTAINHTLLFRVFLSPTRNSQLTQPRFVYSEYDEVYSGPSTSDAVQDNSLPSLVERLVQGAVIGTELFFICSDYCIFIGLLKIKNSRRATLRRQEKTNTLKCLKFCIYF